MLSFSLFHLHEEFNGQVSFPKVEMLEPSTSNTSSHLGSDILGRLKARKDLFANVPLIQQKREWSVAYPDGFLLNP